MGRILIGTCNWADHTGFYPSSLEASKNRPKKISYYADFFPIVEVDSTFYAMQPRRNFELWSERTPDGFVFNVKAYGEMTWHHRDEMKRPIAPKEETMDKFRFMIEPMRDAGKLGAIHFQFPPWFVYRDDHLDYLVSLRQYFPSERLAVEFRHASWLEEHNAGTTLTTLAEHGLTYVMVDEPQVGSGSVPPIVAVTSPRLAVVRFHGRNRKAWYVKDAASSADRFNYLYSRGELAEWVPRIQDVSSQVQELHVLTNNNQQNYAVVNAFDLSDLLHVPLKQPPPPPVLETMRLRMDAEAAEADGSA